MSLSAARTQLKSACSDLMVKWEQTQERWDDPASRAFQKEFLAPMDRLSHSAVTALDEMTDLLARVQRECE